MWGGPGSIRHSAHRRWRSIIHVGWTRECVTHLGGNRPISQGLEHATGSYRVSSIKGDPSDVVIVVGPSHPILLLVLTRADHSANSLRGVVAVLASANC